MSQVPLVTVLSRPKYDCIIVCTGLNLLYLPIQPLPVIPNNGHNSEFAKKPSTDTGSICVDQ